jgi:replicative DNA helicase
LSEFDNFINFSENFDSLESTTIENGKGLLSFGIPFLDDALRGISKTDVILLGAGSGAGKSEAAFHIAFHNASLGKKVLLFALEAEKKEVELRQLYKFLSKEYYSDPYRVPGRINYPDFYYGKCWEQLGRYKEKAREKFKSITNLFIRYSEEGYTLEKFAVDVHSYKDADLIVLDHLHYLELGDESENKAFKKAVQAIRKTVLDYNIPVILVSQLRKESSGNRYTSAMPDISDFHGSSDIFKVATKGIMLASGENVIEENHLENIRPTLIKAVKNRLDGSVKVYVGAMNYDFRTNSYSNSYAAGKLIWSLDEKTKQRVERFVQHEPYWAIGAQVGPKL